MKYWTVLVLVLALFKRTVTERKQYGMYVWSTGFDKIGLGCDEDAFMEWDDDSSCFTHTWNKPGKRDWLWSTCNVEGREISAVFISGLTRYLKGLFVGKKCCTCKMMRIKDMLTEGHTLVPDLKIYGLFAVSDLEVSEKDLVKYIVYYNDVCATSPAQRFDGVAVNNEAYAPIKCGDMAARLEYLDNLQEIATEAENQVHGTLLTHYSMGWHWGRCGGEPSMMTWNGATSIVNHHMIDIFDSTDVQVAYIKGTTIATRMDKAGIDYAESKGKPIFATVYTNKRTLCQTTFFPDDTCPVPGHSEAAMYAVFDSFVSNDIAYARPCIHYFRGVYSTGVHPDWPSHDS